MRVKYYSSRLYWLAFVVAALQCDTSALGMTYSYVDFTVPGAADTVLNNINDSGRVVGLYTDHLVPTQFLTPGWQAFVADADGGNLQTLTPQANSIAADAAGINNDGTIVGSFTYEVTEGADTYQVIRGYAYDGTNYQILHVPFDGANDTVVSNIDESGTIYGYWSTDFSIGIEQEYSSGFKAVPDGNGGYTYQDVNLGDPIFDPLTNTFLNGGNAAGDMIATLRSTTFNEGCDIFNPESCTLVDTIQGVLLDDTPIKYPKAGTTRASDINENGTIVGVGTFAHELQPEVYEFYNVAYSVSVDDLASLPPDDVPYTLISIPGNQNRYMQDAVGIEPNGQNGLQAISNTGVIVGFYDDDDGVYRGFIGTPNESVVGDYNGNGIVDLGDYTVWRDHLGESVAAGTGADGDNSGVVDPGDYMVWRTAFSGTPGNAVGQSVPEPAAVSLVAGLVTIALRAGICRRHRVVEE